MESRYGQRRVVQQRPTQGRATVGLVGQQRRAPRHAGVFAAVHRFDAQLDEAARAELAAWVRDQYAVEYGDVPLGFVAECHLGPPYVDHRLDLLHSILDHFAPAQRMPDPFERARMLVRSGGYVFVEVHASGELVPVRADGSVVTGV